MSKFEDKVLGAMFGLAIGDSLGALAEFKERDSFKEITTLAAGGFFNLQAGEWTDDTSQALCLAYSLIEKNGFNATDQLEKYLAWWQTGLLSCLGYCFDIGGQTAKALKAFEKTGAIGVPTNSTGNGAIMRLAPVAIAYAGNAALVERNARSSARLTHNNEIAMACAGELAIKINEALWSGSTVKSVLNAHATKTPAAMLKRLSAKRITSKRFTRKDVISDGDSLNTLEAALWCFANHDSYTGAVLAAANLGDDADTVAAVTGQLAGAFYGIDGIPSRWVARVAKSEWLLVASTALANLNQRLSRQNLRLQAQVGA